MGAMVVEVGPEIEQLVFDYGCQCGRQDAERKVAIRYPRGDNVAHDEERGGRLASNTPGRPEFRSECRCVEGSYQHIPSE